MVRDRRGRLLERRWSLKQWNVLDGLKVNGAGSGYFEYRVALAAGLELAGDVAAGAFLVEASAKQLFGKDRARRRRACRATSCGDRAPTTRAANPNSYPMTDTGAFPSAVTVRVNGIVAGRHELPDDPADHRGILSWHAQLRGPEAAGGGILRLPARDRRSRARRSSEAAAEGALLIRLEVDEALPGGLAIYGARFGRYPVDPTVVFVRKD